MKRLIAEISNHHMGSLELAKSLIAIAKDSGADLVKGQAFEAKDIVQYGMMDLDFYEKVAFSLDEYLELIEYGKEMDIPVFFTVLSPSLSKLIKVQGLRKIPALTYLKSSNNEIKSFDQINHIVSIAQPRHGNANYKFKRAQVLYATKYCGDFDKTRFNLIQKNQPRQIGLSHHGKNHEEIINLLDEYNFPVIEKHLWIGDEIIWNGKRYRDCNHSASPEGFYQIAKAYKG